MLSEMLAVIEAMDPTTLPLWLTTAAAAAMYPLGLMLGSSCSPCCSPCGCPVNEELPDAVKVTFSGLTQSALKTSGNLLSLSFDSCFGSGASGSVNGVGGLPNEGGPITGVALTGGGGGYAVLGHVEPTGLTITGGSGGGAEFAISLSSAKDDCGLPAWAISSVKVTKQAEGYIDGEALSVSLGADEYEIEAATLSVLTVPTEPTLTAFVSDIGPGFGALLAVTTKQVSSDPNRWGVDSVAVTNGGQFYYDEDQVVFTADGDGVQVTAATGVAKNRRDAPQIVFDYKEGPGSGATFSPVVSKIAGASPVEYQVSSVTVTNGGSGYESGRKVYFKRSYNPRGVTIQEAVYEITASGGVITALTKVSGGRYYVNSGVVESVEVTNAGSYYGPSTTAGFVTVQNGGRFYKTSEEVPAHAANVTVTVTQQPPSNGSGAVISPTIDSTVGSPTFGQITGLSITNGGSNYVEWSYYLGACCADRINDWTAFCARTSPTSCEYFGACCDTGDVRVTYRGKDTPPLVTLNANGMNRYCRISFEGRQQDAPFACDPMNFTAYDVFGGEASVEAASGSDKKSDYPCPPCCSKYPTDDETTCYDQQECAENDGSWLTKCSCSSCRQCDEPQSLIVTLTYSVEWFKIDTSHQYPLGFTPPPVPEFFNVVVGQWVTDTKERTITLTQENGWSEVSDDYVPPSCYVCFDGEGANAGLGNAEDLNICAVYGTTWTDWLEQYVLSCNFNQTYAPDGSLNPQWCQIFKTGQYRWPMRLNGETPSGRGVQVPSADGCFVGGGERTSTTEGAWFGSGTWSVTISVTVAT